MIQKIWNAKTITLLDQMIFSGTTFLSTLIITHLCSPEEFGRFSLIFSLMLFGLPPMRGFTVQPMMANPNKFSNKEYFSSNFIICVVLSILLSGVYVFVWYFWGTEYQIEKLSFTIFGFCFFRYLIDVMRGYFFCYKKPLFSLLMDSTSLIILLLLFSQHHMGGMNFIQVLQVVNYSYFGGIVLGMCIVRPSFNFNPSLIRKNLNFGYWLSLSGVMIWFNGNYLILASVSILGPTIAGLIRAIQNIFAPIHILLQVVDNYTPVRAALILEEKGPQEMKNYLLGQLKIVFFIFLPLFITLSLASGFIISNLFGDAYLPAKRLLPFFALLQCIGLFGRYMMITFQTLNYTQPIFWGYCTAALVCISTAKYFFIYFNILGAGIGIITVQLVFCTVCFFFLQREMTSLMTKETQNIQ